MRKRCTRNVLGAVLAGALMAAASPAVANAQSSQGSDPTPVARTDIQSAARTDIQSAAVVSYRVKNTKSQKYLQPSGGSSAVGAKIVQQPLSSASSQRWALVPDGSYVSFWNQGSDLNMGIDGASTSAGAAAIQATPSGDANQDWLITWRSDTVFEMKNRKSGLCLGISGASTANGAQAAQFPCDGTANQGWAFTE
ncbi:RICIN domain-containing protein [Streptomyces sp. NPDC093591]|uniref:RICIN domain-containing protein n=1 Tax=Streptomyces sp. NPDC093591 TaxID=3366044 RepID=UPI0037F50C19